MKEESGLSCYGPGQGELVTFGDTRVRRSAVVHAKYALETPLQEAEMDHKNSRNSLTILPLGPGAYLVKVLLLSAI